MAIQSNSGRGSNLSQKDRQKGGQQSQGNQSGLGRGSAKDQGGRQGR